MCLSHDTTLPFSHSAHPPLCTSGASTRSSTAQQDLAQALNWFGLVWFLLLSNSQKGYVARPCGLTCYQLSDKLSPAIFICRLMEVLRKLVGTVSLLSPPYLLLRFQPFLPALGKAVLCPLLVVTALTSLIHLLLNRRSLLILSAPKQDDLLPLPPSSPLSLMAL